MNQAVALHPRKRTLPVVTKPIARWNGRTGNFGHHIVARSRAEVDEYAFSRKGVLVSRLIDSGAHCFVQCRVVCLSKFRKD
jgi:hypothetical protein